MDKKEIIASLENEMKTLEKEYQENIASLKRTITILKSDKNGSLISIPDIPGSEKKSVKTIEKPTPAKRKKNKSGRRRKGTLADNILTSISESQRFLQNSEITQLLETIYPEKMEDPVKLKRQISSTLSLLKKNGQLISYQKGKTKRDVYWGLAKWLDDEGQIKTEYFKEANA